MKLTIRKLFMALAVLPLVCSPAMATILDFESGVYSDELGSADPNNPDTYTQEGYTLQVQSPGNHIDPGFGGGLIFHNGGLNTTSDNDLILSFGGAAFDVISFDILDIFGFNAVDVTGSDGSFQAFDGLGTQMVNFTNITSLIFSTIGVPGDFPTIDNIVVEESVAVSEPATLVLFGIGLIGFGLARRRA